MKVLSSGTKIRVIGAVLFVVMLIAAGAYAGNRIISDSSDNSVTFITNSNGGHWDATGDNIQLAINDLNDTHGGKVSLPAADMLLNESLQTWNLSITLEGVGWGETVVPTTIPVTRLRINKYVLGGFNDYALKIGTDTHCTVGVVIKNIIIDGRDSTDASGGIYMRNCQHCTIENVMVDDFFKTSPPAVGINMTSVGATGCYYNLLENVYVRRCTIGIRFGYNTNANSLLSGVITNGKTIAGDYPIGILMHDADTNSVYNIDIEGHTDGTAIVIESDLRAGSANRFIGTRMEGNDKNILIRIGNTGMHQFIGGSCSNTIGTSITDNGTILSRFIGFADADNGFYRDNAETFIRNSKGKYWTATGNNLQSAFDDLNNLSGWVSIPSNISISNTIKIPSNCDFYGFGEHTGLYLADGSDCNMIENYDQSGGNDNIKIRNMKLNGNAAGQTYAWDNHPVLQHWVIFFQNVNDSVIDNCNITGGIEGNVYWLYGERNSITDSVSSWAGSTIPNTVDNTACGFFLENVDDTTIQNVVAHDNYANGVTFETHYQLSYPGENFSKNWKIVDSTFYNNFAGVYCEKAKDGLISNCVSHHNNNQRAYSDGTNASGFILGLYSHNITIEGCLSHHNGDLSGGASARGFGYSVTSISTIGGNCSIIDCKSYSNVWHCYNFNMEDIKMQGCTSNNAGYYGVYYTRSQSGCTIDISGNTIINPVDDGINIFGDNSYDWSGIVSYNIIDGSGDLSISIGVIEHLVISNNAITNSVDDGIYITGGTGAPYMGNHTVSGNNIQSSDMGIYLVNTNDTIVTDNRVIANRGCVESGLSNYTLLDSNNFRGCTNAHTVDATGSKVGTNILFDGS